MSYFEKLFRKPVPHVHRFSSDIGWSFFDDAQSYAVYCTCGEFRLYEVAEKVSYSE